MRETHLRCGHFRVCYYLLIDRRRDIVGTTYQDAGVDIDAATRFEHMIRERVAEAWPGGTADEIGRFAGSIAVPGGTKKFSGSTDGTGTKAIIAALKRHFPNLVTPPKEDICYATTNRQAAVKAIASQCDVVLVVGSQSSSNSNRLREVAEAQGAKKAYLIDRAVDIQPKWLKGVETIGVTSGASAPDDLVKEVVLVLKTMGAEACEEVEEVDEHVYFSLPKDLIDAAADSEDAKEIIEKHRIASGTKMRTK